GLPADGDRAGGTAGWSKPGRGAVPAACRPARGLADRGPLRGKKPPAPLGGRGAPRNPPWLGGYPARPPTVPRLRSGRRRGRSGLSAERRGPGTATATRPRGSGSGVDPSVPGPSPGIASDPDTDEPACAATRAEP